MRREPKLQDLPEGGIKLKAEHFRKVVRRIESIVPKEDPKEPGYIKVTEGENDGGMYISLKAKPIKVGVINAVFCIEGQTFNAGILVDASTIPANIDNFTQIELLTGDTEV